MVDDERMPLEPGETPEMRLVRFRTLGCYPLTGAIESDAATLADIVAEMETARVSERQGRLIDTRRSGVDGKEEARGLFLMDAPSADRAQPLAKTRPDARTLLRFLTCGSVDDGKSTLIGRLLYDSKLIFEDQLAALATDSARHGTTGEDIDFALLVDGLEAEREQGITIDVAYRFFATAKRTFIVADTPGHEQYTRNMATGASTADLAVILIDARKGVLAQTRRHSLICSLLGIRHVVAGGEQDRSGRLRPGRSSSASSPTMRRSPTELGFASVVPIPISARYRRQCHRGVARIRRGIAGRRCCNIWKRSRSTTRPRRSRSAFRCNGSTGRTWIFAAMPAPSPRAQIAVGDPVVVAASGRKRRSVAQIVTYDGELCRAPQPAMPSRSRLPTRSISRAATCWRPRRHGPRSPTSSPRT